MRKRSIRNSRSGQFCFQQRDAPASQRKALPPMKSVCSFVLHKFLWDATSRATLGTSRGEGFIRRNRIEAHGRATRLSLALHEACDREREREKNGTFCSLLSLLRIYSVLLPRFSPTLFFYTHVSASTIGRKVRWGQHTSFLAGSIYRAGAHELHCGSKKKCNKTM